MKNWFEGCEGEKEIKSRYRDLCKEHHPDRGGDLETMKQVNNAYEDVMRGVYTKEYEYEAETVEDFMKQEVEMMETLSKVINLDGLIIDIVGRWIWLTGETRKHKEALGKDGAGFWWSKQKKAWYWRSPEHKFSRSSEPTKSLDELKGKYGTKTFKTGNKAKSKKKSGGVIYLGCSS